MESKTTKRSRKAAEAIDSFIMTYFEEGLMDDFRQLTPLQRIGIIIKSLGLRLPKYKAIELNGNQTHTATSFGELVGSFFSRFTSRP